MSVGSRAQALELVGRMADRLAAHVARIANQENRTFGYANLAVRGRLLDDIAGQQVDNAQWARE